MGRSAEVKLLALLLILFGFLKAQEQKSQKTREKKSEVVEIIRPVNYELVNENAVPVVVRVDPSRVRELKIVSLRGTFPIQTYEEVRVSPEELPEVFTGRRYVFELKGDKDFYCKTVEIDYGINRIHVVAVMNDGSVLEKVVEVYLRSPVLLPFKYPPAEYREVFFHREENEKLCAKCHNMTSTPAPSVAPEDETVSPCYTCHRTMVEKNAFKHAPAKFWMCNMCHTGETGLFNKKFKNQSKHMAPLPINVKCYLCHADKSMDLENRRFHHIPVLTGKCNICHNPHGSEERFFLRREKWSLCITCHEDKATKGHVVFTITGNPHPTKGVKDPRYPEKELSCTSCHNPHHSDYDFLLYDPFRQLCMSCHSE
ncbi:MAG: hypothetical protein GXN96_05995 [Aquificae bacterium]|nr:hypothetical protein [Aquificota bacterium]